jgi:hypothetical protein
MGQIREENSMLIVNFRGVDLFSPKQSPKAAPYLSLNTSASDIYVLSMKPETVQEKIGRKGSSKRRHAL